MKIRAVVATRERLDNFFTNTATGRSLARATNRQVEIRVFAENRDGLPKIYNQAIRESIDDPAILVFVHDDVYFLDYFFFDRIEEGLKQFDVIGVAGNKRRLPKQPSWAFIDTTLTWDDPANLSGIVGHGKNFPPDVLSVYGPSRQSVKILDGVLLACTSSKLLGKKIFFDERFDFHLYDLDFCREAEKKGLSCGTWDLSLLHESGGNFGGADWALGVHRYLAKWNE